MEQTNGSALLRDGERLDDLQTSNLSLIQRPDGYCFTADAVLLAHFARYSPKDVLCDLCTGSGIVLVLALGKYAKTMRGFGVEIDAEAADRARRSLLLNGLEQRGEVLCANAVDAPHLLAGRGITLVTANPPYRKRGTGKAAEANAAARHEVLLTAEELFTSVSRLLNTGGRFALVHRADRMAELIALSYRLRLTPKRLRLVQPQPGAPPHLFLMEAVKDGRDGLAVEPPLVLLNADGSETEEVKRIYA